MRFMVAQRSAVSAKLSEISVSGSESAGQSLQHARRKQKSPGQIRRCCLLLQQYAVHLAAGRRALRGSQAWKSFSRSGACLQSCPAMKASTSGRSSPAKEAFSAHLAASLRYTCMRCNQPPVNVVELSILTDMPKDEYQALEPQICSAHMSCKDWLSWLKHSLCAELRGFIDHWRWQAPFITCSASAAWHKSYVQTPSALHCRSWRRVHGLKQSARRCPSWACMSLTATSSLCKGLAVLGSSSTPQLAWAWCLPCQQPAQQTAAVRRSSALQISPVRSVHSCAASCCRWRIHLSQLLHQSAVLKRDGYC